MNFVMTKTFQSVQCLIGGKCNEKNKNRTNRKMKDFYKSVIGERENPYSYEHELTVQKTLCRVVGEN